MIGIIIVNYNSSEQAEKLAGYILSHVKIPYRLYLIDNGSNTPSGMTTHYLARNRDVLGGVLYGMEQASRDGCAAYWTLSTSMEFVEANNDPAEELYNCLLGDIVAVSPLWTGDSRSKPHQRLMRAGYTNIMGAFAMWDAAWVDKYQPFDPELSTSWGSDFEAAYLARLDDKKLFICDRVVVRIYEGSLYTGGRNRIPHNGSFGLDARRDYARKQMNDVLTRKYGADWKKVLDAD